MADIEQLSRAFMAADKAGDTKSAQLLANAIRELQAGQAQPESPAPTTPTQEEAPDTSILGALGQGVDQSGAMVGKGIQSAGEYAGVDAIEAYGAEMAQRNEAQLAASNYQRPEGADGIIKNLKEGEFANAGNSLLYGAAEAAPQVAGGVVASVGAGLAATSAPILGTAAAISGTIYGTVNALGQVRDEKEQQELDPTATGADLATAVASGLVELLPIKGGGATLKVLREAGQEGVQESLIIGNSMVQGGEYVPQEVFERVGDAAITGGAIAKGVNIGISTVNKAGEVVLRPKEDLDPETSQAAGDVARLIEQLATDNGYKLKDVDPNSKKGASLALEQARDKLNIEIDEAGKTLRKEIIGGLDQEVKSRFNAVINSARTKVARTVNKGDIQFLKDTVGSSKQGQMLVQSMYKTNVLTELSSAGLKGGVSQFTDLFNPLNNIGRGYNPARDVGGLLNIGAVASTGGTSLATQVPLVVGGRAIDAVTGRRSKINRFVQKNKGKDGLGEVTGPSIEGRSKALSEAKAAEAKSKGEQAKLRLQQRYASQYAAGDTPSPKSPRGIMHEGYREINKNAGRSAQFQARKIDEEIEAALSVIEAKAISDNDTSTINDVADYREAIRSGRQTSEGALTSIIGKVKTALADGYAANPQAPNSPQGPAPEGPPPLSPQAARGKAENEALLATLRGTMEADTTISDADRSILSTAFDDLKMNLGKNPLEGAEGIMGTAVAKLSDPSLAETHLSPYISRVRQQQKAKDVPPVTPATSPSGPDGPTVAGAVEPSGPVDSGQPIGPALAQPTGPPQLATSDPVPTKPKKVKKPTAKSVKKAMPEAKAIIEIGRKGSKYENGIQDVDQALEVAQLLGITAQMMNSGTALQKSTNSGKGTAALHRWRPSMKGFGSSVFFVKPGGSLKGEKNPKIASLMQVLHEMGHSLTQGNMDGQGEFGIGRVRNPFSGNLNEVGENSYNMSVMKPILEGLGPAHPAIKEIIAFQNVGKGFTESKPLETVPVREFGALFKKLNESQSTTETDHYKREMGRYRRYTNQTAELSVDPMWLYLMNPRLAKELMPINTKLIRDEFKKANNGKIQFFSHPFATILAIVSAMAALGLGDDSEEELPDGALSPMPGALSA